MFCLRTFCPSGHFVPTEVLSAGHFVSGCYVARHFISPDVLSLSTFCLSVRFVSPYVLSLRTFCLSVRFVSPYVSSLRTFRLSVRFVSPYVLSLRTFSLNGRLVSTDVCLRTICLGTFYLAH